MSAVQATHESKLPYYGAVGGRLAAGHQGLYEIAEVVEKPTPTEAEQKLIVPGLRAGSRLFQSRRLSRSATRKASLTASK